MGWLSCGSSLRPVLHNTTWGRSRGRRCCVACVACVALSPPQRGWEMLLKMEFSSVLILPSTLLLPPGCPELVHPAACLPRCGAASPAQHRLLHNTHTHTQHTHTTHTHNTERIQRVGQTKDGRDVKWCFLLFTGPQVLLSDYGKTCMKFMGTSPIFQQAVLTRP